MDPGSISQESGIVKAGFRAEFQGTKVSSEGRRLPREGRKEAS